MMQTEVKDVLRLADMTGEDLGRLRRFTIDFGADPEGRGGALRDGTVLCWLTVPSRGVSYIVSVATRQLGGAAVALDPDELRARRVGSLENAARVLSSLGRLLVVGGLEDHDVNRLAAAASVPVVNAFSDRHNPCEALAELATLEQRIGSLQGVRLAYLGQSCNVTHDLMAGAALAGATLWVATPEACQPSPSITAHASVLAARHGGHLQLTRRPAQAVERADGIVLGPLPRSWRNMDPGLVASANRDVALLSCSPDGDCEDWPIDTRRLLRDEHQESRLSAYKAVLYALSERVFKRPAGEPSGEV